MIKWIIRTMAFFFKEVNEVRRQPNLFLSLIGGPFLVLAFFGATFQSTNPVLPTALVWPKSSIPGVNKDQVVDLINRNFKLVAVVDDKEQALDMLKNGQIEVIQIIPADIKEQVKQGDQPALEVITRSIDPTREAWIKSLAFTEVDIINREILKSETGQAQNQAVNVDVQLETTHDIIVDLNSNYSSEKQKELRSSLDLLDESLVTLQAFMPPPTQVNEMLSPELKEMYAEVNQMRTQVKKINQAIDSGELDAKINDMANFDDNIIQLRTTIEGFVKIPPEKIVSPVQGNYVNLRQQAYDLVIFFAPGVLALLIQHLSVTLGALALVREKQMGAFEIFRVAPLHILQVLIGKYMGYTLYISITAATLILLLKFIHVPMLGSWPLLVALILLLTLASLGIGFLISALSSSDSQAIQLSMLVLLFSIFFSGFFLTLDGFAPAAKAFSLIIPMSHGLSGFQSIMLLGREPVLWTWVALAITAVALFGLVWYVVGREAYHIS